jgi:hypothetical protein
VSQEATRIALDTAGAVAFSRTGDLGTGEFQEAKVLVPWEEVADLSP